MVSFIQSAKAGRHESKGAVRMTTKIEGNALYLELVANPELSEEEQRKFLGWQNESTKQMIIFPVTELSNGLRRGVIMSRVVGKYTRKAQWDFEVYGDNTRNRFDLSSYASFIANPEEDSFSYYRRSGDDYWDTYSVDEKAQVNAIAMANRISQELVGSSYDYDTSTYTRKQAWVVRDNKPFAVEYTTEDIELAVEYTTPQAVIRRINKVRGTLDNFPEKLVSSS